MVPRVSVGLPVFNGERFVRKAIESVLDQTWTDLELIISDNASTDRTQDICFEYAALDRRVRYFRQDKNIGAGPNFNFVLYQATGEFFKWMAHDDVIAPSFIERCIEILDEDHSYVLASTRVKVCNADLTPMFDYGYDLMADSEKAFERFHQQIRGHQCYEVFGVIRRVALVKTPGIGSFFAADAALLLRLVLLGKFFEVPDLLFFSRQHEDQSERLRGSWQEYMVWYNPNNADKIHLPYWILFHEYANIVRTGALALGDRLRCGFSVLAWAARRWKPLGREVAMAVLQVPHRLWKYLAHR